MFDVNKIKFIWRVNCNQVFMFSWVKAICLKYFYTSTIAGITVTIIVPTTLYLSPDLRERFVDAIYKIFKNPVEVDFLPERNREGKFAIESESWDIDRAIQKAKYGDGKYSNAFLKWVGWEKGVEERSGTEFYYIPRLSVDIDKFQKFIEDNDLIPPRLHNPAFSKEDAKGFLNAMTADDYISFIFGLVKHWMPFFPFGLYVHNSIELFSNSAEYGKKRSEFRYPSENFDEPPQVLRSEPSDILKSKVDKYGLKYIDTEYDLRMHMPLLPGEAPFRYFLDLKVCPLSKEDGEKLSRLSKREYYFGKIDDLWRGDLPLVMKFYVQNFFDKSRMHAENYLKIIEKNKFSCIGYFTFVYNILSEPYEKLSYKKLQSLYDEYFLKK